MRRCFNLLLAFGIALGCTTTTTSPPVNRGDAMNPAADAEEVGTSCPLAGFRLCGGVCVNGATDPANCGACGRACASTEVCLDGACALNCGPLTRCFEMSAADGGADGSAADAPAQGDASEGGAGGAAVCADLMSSGRHCGACNRACADGEVCRAGMCAPRGCPTGLTECMVAVPLDPGDGGLDGGGGDAGADAGEVATRLEARCLDTQNHAEHCGGCGMACAFGQRCRAGRCEAYCPAGTSMCGMSGCTALQLDPANCGSCGRACPAANVCVDGQCSLTCGPLTRCTRTPDAGAPDGGDAGAPVDFCADTQSDPANCGRCGNACAAHERCESGACRVRCASGQIECGGQCVDPRTDARNCGSCGRACAAGQACEGGADGGAPSCVATCAAPFSECAPDGGTPYCANLQVDPANCGACRRACPAGQSCVSGSCGLVCPAGQLACPTMAPTACVDPRVDPANCGACGRVCDPSQSCSGGACCTTTTTATAAYRGCTTGGGAGCTSSFVLRNGQSAAQGFSVGASGGFLVRARLHVSNPHAAFGRAARVYVVQGTSGTSLADNPFNFDRDAMASAPVLGTSTANWAEAAFAPPVRVEAGRTYFLVLRLPDFPVSPCPAPCITRDSTCDCPALTWTLADDNSSPSADPFSGGFAFSCGAACPSFNQEPARRDQAFEVYIANACGL